MDLSAPEQGVSNQEQHPESNMPEPVRAASSDEESDHEHDPTADSNLNLSKWTTKFTKYITALEGRIKELETKADIDVEAGSKIRRSRESTEIVQFFLASDEPRSDRAGTKDTRWKAKGTFMSEVDENPLVRVLYRRTGADLDPSHEPEPQKPSPSSIDILEIRICSKSVANLLYDKLQFEFGKQGLLHFTKPFRPLIRVFGLIREHLEKLERSHGPLESAAWRLPGSSHPIQTPNTPPSSIATPPASPIVYRTGSTKSLGANAEYHDFRNLSNFLNEYLGPKLELYDAYAHAKLDKVSFDNLWMLFDAGDIVYSPSKKEGYKIQHGSDSTARTYTTAAVPLPQAFKVLGTVGGIPLKKSLTMYSDTVNIQTSAGSQQSMVGGSKYKLSPLHVFCYSLDFNGYRILDVRDAFRFPPFDGEKEVTSLDGYPLRYKKEPTQPSEDLDARGKAFIDLMVVRHKRYDGLAATEKKEEVKSDVIIDMDLSTRGKPWLVPWYGKPLEDSWFTKTAKEAMEVPKRTCNHTRCHDPGCIKDVYLEQQRTVFNEFAAELDAKLEQNELLKITTEEDIERCKKVMEKEKLLVLFPGIVSGYSLRNRKWVRLDIGQLQDVTYQDGWNDLVLPKGHKKMVQAMVETFATKSRLKTSQQDAEADSEEADRFGFDLVKKKGQGCIILLHGAPGVGKTSTAECVAAHTRRPLFPITSGDIGFSPDDIENRLQENFDLAHKWGCVLLLDEADVFLAKRNREDIKRNGLVSVFLRVLEYYSGILILTTNRVGAFDEAFHSRIHLSLLYPSLDLKKSLKIFDTNFRRIDKHNEDRTKRQDKPMKIEDKKIQQYWRKNHEVLNWNGRQIRNAFQTAMALADCQAREKGTSPIITVKHFETIANASVDFAKYMAMVHGNDADRLAELDKIRLGHIPEIPRGLKKVKSDSDDSGSDGSVSKDISSESSDEEEKSRRKSKKKAKEREAKKEKSMKEEKGKKKLSSSKRRSRKSEDSESEGD